MKSRSVLSDVSEYRTSALKNRNVRKAYNTLKPRYDLIRQVLEAREKQRLTQAMLAKKMGTKQTAIARFESGSINPTLAFLERMAKAIKTPLTLSIPG